MLAFKLVNEAPDPLKVVAVTVPVLETVNLAVPFWSPVLIRKLDESLFKVHAGDPAPTIKLVDIVPVVPKTLLAERVGTVNLFNDGLYKNTASLS